MDCPHPYFPPDMHHGIKVWRCTMCGYVKQRGYAVRPADRETR